MKLRLSHKGQLLVGSVLIVELVFIGSLMHLLSEVERNGILEEHSKKVVGKTNHIFQLIFDAGSCADRYLKNERPQDQELFNKHRAQLYRNIQEIKPLVKDQPIQLARVDEMDKDSTRGFSMLGNLMELVRTEGHDAATRSELEHIEEMRSIKARLIYDLRLLMEEQNKLVKDSFARRIKSVQDAKNWMVVGLFFNIFAALAAALFFTKGVTSRLQVLVDNTVRLKNGVKLKQPIGGTDEIAQLDMTFHEMADALTEASIKRREMVAMITHDLRTPLTSVQGFLSILSRNGYGEVPETVLNRSQMAQSSVSRLISLINDLLDLEQLESGKMALQQDIVSSAGIVESALESVKPAAEEKTIEIKDPPEHFELYADEDRVVRVLVNLLSNAIKFSERGKPIELTVAPIDDDDSIEFSVTDHGRGISAEEQEILFVPFQQLRPREDKRNGSGLGLAICKAITEQHGGTIGVTSTVGEGSRFWFRLPRNPPPE